MLLFQSICNYVISHTNPTGVADSCACTAVNLSSQDTEEHINVNVTLIISWNSYKNSPETIQFPVTPLSFSPKIVHEVKTLQSLSIAEFSIEISSHIVCNH